MLFNQVVAVVLIVTGAATAVNIPTSHVLHEKRSMIPTAWTKRSQAAKDVMLPVQIGLKPRNMELGHDHLMAISDPTSSRFGQHWTPKQVHDFFAPNRATVSAVQEWLVSSGIANHRHQLAASRSHVRFEASVNEIESLLKTQYDVWEHEETGSISVSCDEYSVPKHISHHIDYITPTIGLNLARSPADHGIQKRLLNKPVPIPVPLSEKPTSLDDLANCSTLVSPACIRALYNVPVPTTAVQGNELGIFEAGDTYDQAGLDDLFWNASPNIPNGTHPILQSIDGGTGPVPPGRGAGECELDLSLAYPLIYPQQIRLFETFDMGTAAATQGIFDAFLDAIDASYCTYDGGDDPAFDPIFPNKDFNQSEQCGTFKPPNVVSLSYEIAEAFYTPAYEIRQCHEYMKLGLMGTSVIFSSGDNGTVSRAGIDGCLANGAQNPSSPSTCPYVTSVGATQIQPGAAVTAPEVAVDPQNNPFAFADNPMFSSGGGFSNIFTQPSYQSSAVSTYLNSGVKLPASNTYNSTGRAFPDVAAVGYHIMTWGAGGPAINEGTSASAPIFGSIINRLNEERIMAGKKPVGFLNQILYSNPGMFNDIVEGYNLGCNAAPAFNASTGWDPVTGLGTPNYPKMLDVFMSLP